MICATFYQGEITLFQIDYKKKKLKIDDVVTEIGDEIKLAHKQDGSVALIDNEGRTQILPVPVLMGCRVVVSEVK